MGIDGIWIGVILVKMLEIGLLTPPIGLNVFVVKGAVGPDIPMAIVGAPGYLQANPAPASPQELAGHRGINLRLPTPGTVNAWRLMQGVDFYEVSHE